MSVERTPLQEWQAFLYLLLDDARVELDYDQWRVFVWIAGERIEKEAAKLTVREAEAVTEEAAW